MAQPQTQAKEASPANPKTTSTMPATRSRGMAPMSPDPMLSWAAGPFGLMRRLSDDMDQLFGQLIGSQLTGGMGGAARGLASAFPATAAPAVDWMPALETFERGGNLIVQADLPGLAADDVTVEVEDDLLTISGERREEREVDDEGIHRTERRYGRFTRSIVLPEGAQAQDVQASFHNGVLEISVPIKQQAQRRRTVEVQNVPAKEPGGAAASPRADAGSSARGASQNAAAGGAKSDTTTPGARSTANS
jgi:HSP20 family protein